MSKKSVFIKGLMFLLALILFTTHCYSKNSDIYDLLKEADLSRSSDIKKFNTILQKIEPIKNVDVENYFYYTYLKGYQASYQGNYKIAIELFKEVYEEAQDKNLKFRSASSLVNVYGISRNFIEGLRLINYLLGEYKNITSKTDATRGLLTSSIFYIQMDDYSYGKKLAELALKTADNNRLRCYALHQIHEAEVILSPSLNLVDNLNNSIDFCAKNREIAAVGFILLHKAYNYEKLGLDELALKIAIELEASLVDIEYKTLSLSLYSLLSDIHFKLLHFSQAKNYALKTLHDTANLGNLKSKVNTYKILSGIAEIEGSYQEALNYQKEYVKAENAYLDSIRIKEVAIQRIKNETLEKTNQIALLDKENTLLKTQSELAKKNTENDRLFMALLSLVIVLIFLWAYKNRRMHKKLRKLAETDELTGIANRYHFSQLANAAISYCEKSRQPLSFILFDLDFFKKINDNFGHLVGDWALKQAVLAAQAVCRNNDVMGRLGGEEFGIILPGCAADKALLIAESCRLAIAAVDSAESGHAFKVTASFGVADTSCCAYELDKLFAAADTALYQSKDLGRNRVYRYQNEQLTLAIQ